MVFGNGVKNMQAVVYNRARTVYVNCAEIGGKPYKNQKISLNHSVANSKFGMGKKNFRKNLD